jgi:hypothetical protein
VRHSVSLLRVHHSGRRIDLVASICITAVEVGALPRVPDTDDPLPDRADPFDDGHPGADPGVTIATVRRTSWWERS